MSISGEVIITAAVSLLVGLSANWAKIAVQRMATQGQSKSKGSDMLESEIRELKRENSALRNENMELKQIRMHLEFQRDNAERELAKAERNRD